MKIREMLKQSVIILLIVFAFGFSAWGTGMAQGMYMIFNPQYSINQPQIHPPFVGMFISSTNPYVAPDTLTQHQKDKMMANVVDELMKDRLWAADSLVIIGEDTIFVVITFEPTIHKVLMKDIPTDEFLMFK